MEMTRLEFAELRDAAQRRYFGSMYPDPPAWSQVRNDAAVERMLEDRPFSPPMAGDWIRDDDRLWHRFGGDLTWGPAYSSPGIRSVDGVKFSAVTMQRAATRPLSDVCRRCDKL